MRHAGQAVPLPYPALEPLFRTQVRTRVEGLDVLDRVRGPVIFVANHASHLDTPLILLSLPDAWRRRRMPSQDGAAVFYALQRLHRMYRYCKYRRVSDLYAF